MSENEEMISFVDSSMKLEGMALSLREKQTMRACLTGQTTFKSAIDLALKKYRKLAH